MRLGRTYPNHVAELHRRASDWYAQNNFSYEAITHALIVQDWTRAAEVIERFSDQLPMRGERNTLLSWFKSFPNQILMDRRLALTYAWSLSLSNQLNQTEHQLSQLMPLVQTTPSLLGEYYVIRVMIAALRYDIPAVVEWPSKPCRACRLKKPRLAVEFWSPWAWPTKKQAVISLLPRGAFREAYELGKASPSPSSVGNAPLPLTALAYLADYEYLQGNLRGASRMYEQAIELASKWGGNLR